MLSPACPKAGPTGGAGLAPAAGIKSLIVAVTVLAALLLADMPVLYSSDGGCPWVRWSQYLAMPAGRCLRCPWLQLWLFSR